MASLKQWINITLFILLKVALNTITLTPENVEQFIINLGFVSPRKESFFFMIFNKVQKWKTQQIKSYLKIMRCKDLMVKFEMSSLKWILNMLTSLAHGLNSKSN
jgi:hypothetical protein